MKTDLISNIDFSLSFLQQNFHYVSVAIQSC